MQKTISITFVPELKGLKVDYNTKLKNTVENMNQYELYTGYTKKKQNSFELRYGIRNEMNEKRALQYWESRNQQLSYLDKPFSHNQYWDIRKNLFENEMDTNISDILFSNKGNFYPIFFN
jgi:hypothetical protein